jgi:UDP:flavonoid glycosyltransferase YjiC (YdhE family)
LRAGIPQVITPVWHDQFDSAKRVHKVGAGIGFDLPLSKISSSDLAAAIDSAMSENVVRVADSYSYLLNEDHAEEEAASMIESFLKSEVKPGLWKKKAVRERELRFSPARHVLGLHNGFP